MLLGGGWYLYVNERHYGLMISAEDVLCVKREDAIVKICDRQYLGAALLSEQFVATQAERAKPTR